MFPEQIIVEVLGPQRAYRPEISRQGCLQGCGCGGRRQYYCFRFNMNLVIHPIETPPRLLAGRGGGAFSRSLKPGPGPRPRAWLGAPDLLYIILRWGWVQSKTTARSVSSMGEVVSGVGDIIGNFTNMVSYQWKPNGGHQALALIKNQKQNRRYP